MNLSNVDLVSSIAEAIATIFGITEHNQFARLIGTADYEQQCALVARELSDEEDGLLARLEDIKKLRQQNRAALKVAPPVPPPAGDPAENGDGDKIETDSALEGDSSGSSKSEETEDAKNGLGAGVKVEGMEHTPKEPRKLKYRVTGLAKQPSGTPVGGGAKADPREAEDVAAAFERSWQRFPVLVGHLVGYQGARCDVLSFSTEEDAEAFQKNTLANPFERAERVIEVKGRGDMNAKILLEGNEFDAAKEHRSKYYLYRVFKDEAPDNWQLAVLKNPYSTESSHLDSLLVSLQKSDQTEKFRISVALKESADLR